MKVVVNRCFGGFGLSYEAVMEYAKRAGFKLYAFESAADKKGNISFDKYVPYTPSKKETTIKLLKNKESEEPFVIHYGKTPLLPDGQINNDTYFMANDIERNDPILIEVVEALGERADGGFAQLEIVKIPDDVEWEISEYDGMESVEEKHRSW
jgi:hypothetical protein